MPLPSFSRKSSSLFFVLFSLCFVACECRWIHRQLLAKGEPKLLFFLFFHFVLFLLHVNGLHCQLLIEKEPKLLLFFFSFLATYGCK